jgi:thiamine transport system ATP-binding protein
VTSRLEVLGGRVCFGSTEALAGVDLEVAAGEVVAVLGPSGSGKSTVLRAIAGLQPLDAGQVLLDGIDVTHRPPHQRGIGMMFQHHALFPHLPVGDNVAFGLRMQGKPRSDVHDRVVELLEVVGLPGTAHRDVATLSGGEQQRVALARALAPQPSVLLLDEPLGSLDRTLRERLLDELRALFAALGMTVVAVTHDHAEAFALADRLVILDRGHVLQSASPPAVWSHPASVRVAELLGFPNIVEVAVVDGRLTSPWGDLGAVQGMGDRVLVRPDAVRLDPGGPLRAAVTAVGFAGARARVRLAIAGAPPLEADVPGGRAPEVGAVLTWSIDPAGVTPLPS